MAKSSTVLHKSVRSTSAECRAYFTNPSAVLHKARISKPRRKCRQVSFRIGKDAIAAALRLKDEGRLPSAADLLREIVRGDYQRLAAGSGGG